MCAFENRHFIKCVEKRREANYSCFFDFLCYLSSL
jgi:hypothetical protein